MPVSLKTTFPQSRPSARGASAPSVAATAFSALQVETKRLHRENTRLQNELSSRDGPSFTALQVANTRLRRQVSSLQDNVDALNAQMDRLRAQLTENGLEIVETADIGVQCGETQAWQSSPSSTSRSEPNSPVRMLATADTDRSGDRPPAENAGTEEDEAGENKMSVVQQQMMTERPPALQKRMLQEWLEYGGEQVESCMRSGGIAMLDARWLVNLWDRFPDTQLSLSRRQDLPRKAFLSVDELRVAGCPNEGLPIVVVSAPWLSPFHPDPKGAHLRLVAIALKALLAGGKKYGVFWDWGSIVQPKDRSKEYHRLEAKEQASLDDAMSGLFKLFTHDHTTVFRLTRLPEDFPDAYDLPDFGDPRDEKPQSRVNNIAQYADRGWTFCESQWASWPCKETLDLGNLLDSDGDPPSDRQKLLRRCSSAAGRMVPLPPSEFNATLELKSFHNATDDKPLVIELYQAAYTAYFGATRKLDFSGLGWGDEEMAKLCMLVNSGVLAQLEFLHLSGNQVRDAGMEMLGQTVRDGKLPKCIKIVLDGNPGNDAIVVEALQVQAQEARMERLKTLWPGLKTATIGLKWKETGPPSPVGIEIVNAALSKALQTKGEFTQAEFDAFKVVGLTKTHFIKSGDKFFQPADGITPHWQVMPARMPRSEEDFLFQQPIQQRRKKLNV
jgi:FtsZ-binding cell division protein ZapB